MLALCIIGAWSGLLTFALLLVEPSAEPVPSAIIFVLMTYLSTGLFITAHDAMHGTAWPGQPAWNRRIGKVALRLYAAFDFAALLGEHRRHHASPATSEDPDFHDGQGEGFVGWYFAFLRRYLTLRQLLTMAVVFNIAAHLLHIYEARLLLFWVLPTLLSTLQLFTFGTWLPHRNQSESGDAHRARSSDLPRWLSLLACYHFDYHWEHHAHPHLPWWRLPDARWHRAK